MATLGQPKREKKLSLPPMTRDARAGLGVGDVTEPAACRARSTPPPASDRRRIRIVDLPGVAIRRRDAAPTTSPAQQITCPRARPPDSAAARAEHPRSRAGEAAREHGRDVGGLARCQDPRPGLPTSFVTSPAPAPANAGAANLAAALASAGDARNRRPRHAAKADAGRRVGFQTLQRPASTG